MNIAFVQTFLEVVKTGNLNRAAERLNVTESTVTARLNGLEDLLGQKLLIRSRAGAELTSAGFQFLRYAEVMTRAWSQARQTLSLSADFESVCNVGCQFDLWHGVAKTWADRLRRDHPGVALSFWPGSTDDIESWLSTGLIDVALMFDAAVSGELDVVPLFQDRLIQVATVRRGYMEWDPDYVYVDLGREFRRLHAETFAVARTPVVTLGSSDWARDYLATWGGSAFLPERMVADDIAAGRLHRVEGAPVFRRTSYLVARPNLAAGWAWFRPSVEALRETIAAAAAGPSPA